MHIEPRGTPPYTVWSPTITEIHAHPGKAETFTDALELLLDISNGGEYLNHPWIIEREKIIDKRGATVVSLDNPDDVAWLQQLFEELSRE